MRNILITVILTSFAISCSEPFESICNHPGSKLYDYYCSPPEVLHCGDPSYPEDTAHPCPNDTGDTGDTAECGPAPLPACG